MRHCVRIRYCRQCQWMLRSAWFAQELLTTFAEDIHELVLEPGTGGIFQIEVNDELIWDRKTNSGFPDIKELKQLVRDKVAPDRNLGHSDKPTVE